jgi:uncharacterized protein (TIGR02266 family)
VADSSDRKWERADVNLAVVCRSQEDVLDDIARKLGAGGMFVESERPQPVGSVVELEFSLPGVVAPVQLQGQVAYTCDGSTAEPKGMGIEFVDVEAALRQQMVEIVASVNALSPAAS